MMSDTDVIVEESTLKTEDASPLDDVPNVSGGDQLKEIDVAPSLQSLVSESNDNLKSEENQAAAGDEKNNEEESLTTKVLHVASEAGKTVAKITEEVVHRASEVYTKYSSKEKSDEANAESTLQNPEVQPTNETSDAPGEEKKEEKVGLFGKIRRLSGTAATTLAASASKIAATTSAVVTHTAETIKKRTQSQGGPSDHGNLTEEGTNTAEDAQSVPKEGDESAQSERKDSVEGESANAKLWNSMKQFSTTAAEVITEGATVAWTVTKETTAKAVENIKAYKASSSEETSTGKTNEEPSENDSPKEGEVEGEEKTSPSALSSTASLVTSGATKLWHATKEGAAIAVNSVKALATSHDSHSTHSDEKKDNTSTPDETQQAPQQEEESIQIETLPADPVENDNSTPVLNAVLHEN